MSTQQKHNRLDRIEAEARDGEGSLHVVIFNPDGWGVDPEKEREFADREALEEWQARQPDEDHIIIVEYTGDPPPEPDGR